MGVAALTSSRRLSRFVTSPGGLGAIMLVMEMLTAVGAVVGACTGLVAAEANLWNACQFSILGSPW